MKFPIVFVLALTGCNKLDVPESEPDPTEVTARAWVRPGTEVVLDVSCDEPVDDGTCWISGRLEILKDGQVQDGHSCHARNVEDAERVLEARLMCNLGEEAIVTARAVLTPETGAVVEAVCPDGYEAVSGACEVGDPADQLLLFGEESSPDGQSCDIWNDDDVYNRTAVVSVTCSPV